MKELGLQSFVRVRRYRSYKGNYGKVAPNILKRDFKAEYSCGYYCSRQPWGC